MCKVQNTVDTMTIVSPHPTSTSDMLVPERRNNPIRLKETANQVAEEGLALRFMDGMHRANSGVKNISKPAKNPTLLADVSLIPHCFMMMVKVCRDGIENKKTVGGLGEDV